MKKSLTLCLTFCLLVTALQAQTPVYCPSDNHPGADDCSDACLYCTLQNYTGNMASFTAGAAPGFCSTTFNEQWLGFTAATDTITITATPSDCQSGDGLELALYADCSGAPVACVAGMAGAGNQARVLSAALTPGQPYFLMINGYGGDVCQFTLSVSPVNAVYAPAVDPIGPVQGPWVVAERRTAVFSVDPVAGATEYSWTGPGDWKIDGQPLPVTLPAPGGNQAKITVGTQGGILGVQARNACSASGISSRFVYIGKGPLAPPCPSSDTPAADFCADACVFCNFNGYTGTSGGYTADPAPSFCGQAESNQWIGFVAGAPAATFTVQASNCANGDGLQLALYQNCSDPPLECNGGNAGGAGAPVTVTAPLQPGQNYFLMIDGYAGDACDFTLTVDPPMAALAPPLGTVGPINGPTALCPGATVEYSIPPVSGAAGYTWQAPPGWLINGAPGPYTGIGAGSNTITVTTSPSGGQLTVVAFNSCAASIPVLKNISVSPIPPTILPPVSLCAEDVPYTLPWGPAVSTSGLYFTTFSSYLGCDSIVRQQVTVKAPIFTNLPPQAICPGGSVEICGNTVSFPGTYTAICKAYQGCDSTVSFTIIGLDPKAEILPKQDLLCAVLPVALNSTTSMGTKVWRSLPGGDVVGTGDDLTVDTPGVYTLTVTATAAGVSCIAADTITIMAGAPPQASASGGTLTCALPNLTLDGASDTPGAQFAWSGPNGFSSTAEDPAVTLPGNYSLTVTDPQTGCTGTAVATVDQDTVPPVLPPLDDIALNCTMGTALLSCPITDPGYTCGWTGPGIILPGPIAVSPGYYELVVAGPNGCSATTGLNIVADFTPPTITAYADTLTCDNPTGMIHCSVDIPGATCTSELIGNVYVVTAVAPNGCTATATVSVTIDVAAPTASATGDTLTCSQPVATLTCTTNISDALFEWSGPGNFSSTLQNPETTLAGTYTVAVTDPGNGCSSIATATVLADTGLPQISINPPPVLTCAMPTTMLQATTTAQQPAYLWQGPNGFTSNLPNPVVDAPGIYTLVVTDLQTGCSATKAVLVAGDFATPQLPVFPPVVLGCMDSCLVFSCPPLPGISCCWDGPGLPPCDPDPLICAPGAYTLTVTGPNGCFTSTSITVLFNDTIPVVAVENDTLTCSKPQVNLKCSTNMPGLAFQWTGPNGFNSLFQNPPVDQPGIYTVTVVNVNGCTTTAELEIFEDVQVPAISLENLTHDQNGQGIGAIDVTIAHSGAYTVAWKLDGQFFSNSEDLSGLFAGNYTLEVAGSNGCISVLQVTVLDTIVSSKSVLQENWWTVFPNPASDVLHVQYRGAGQPAAQLWLLDAAGKLVYEQDKTASRAWIIPCGQLPPGTYTLLIRMQDGVVRKLVGVAQ